MDQDLRERLPQKLLPFWDRLASLDVAIMEGIQDSAGGDVGAFAETRSVLLRSLCESLEGIEDTALREETLQALVRRNANLLALGSEALADAAVQSAAGAHQRRAITAYGAQES